MPIRIELSRLPTRSVPAAIVAAVWFAAMPALAGTPGGQSVHAAALATQGDSAAGIPPCSSCHGAKGQGNPGAGFPRLAGLPAGYLLQQLQAFAAGRRSNAVMMPIAKTMTAGQQQAMASYYAALPAPGRVAGHPDADLLRAGAELAQHGRMAQGLPACALCHGRGGVGVSPSFPPLAGQSAAYIVNQLKAWAHDARPPGPMGLMPGVAGKLSDHDMRAVAAYFSMQPAKPDRGTP